MADVDRSARLMSCASRKRTAFSSSTTFNTSAAHARAWHQEVVLTPWPPPNTPQTPPASRPHQPCRPCSRGSVSFRADAISATSTSIATGAAGGAEALPASCAAIAVSKGPHHKRERGRGRVNRLGSNGASVRSVLGLAHGVAVCVCVLGDCVCCWGGAHTTRGKRGHQGGRDTTETHARAMRAPLRAG